ncbi:MAG TPA: ion channel [candidate division Zixibacteria bacterium]|nr:ion channel [candidate division Zixibacteria bacterium]
MSNSISNELSGSELDGNRDLGLGTRVVEQSHTRFLNRDGSFNVRRYGLPFFRSLSVYHSILTIGWIRFYAIVVAGYLAVNLIFASAYYLCGPHALQVAVVSTSHNRYVDCFFFSIQTFTTIGYGRVSPVGTPANILVAVEALTGLLGFAFATGLSFARFSRPAAKIIFSKQAIIAPYRGIKAFEFRIINARSSQIIEVEVKVVLSRLERVGSQLIRQFYDLMLERRHVSFFPLSWTIVHPIDSESPLYGSTGESLNESEAEFLVLVTGIEETFAQQVHTRSSYKAHEVTVNARFADMYVTSGDGALGVNFERIHAVELVPS